MKNCICKKILFCSVRTTLILIDILETFLELMNIVLSIMSLLNPTVKQRLYMNIQTYLFIFFVEGPMVVLFLIMAFSKIGG